jgi:serine/threonine protein kinase
MGESWPDIPGYEVQAELGIGGMGKVYRVRRHADGSILALKMILRGRGASFAELVRFRIEAEALSCLNHPNIIKIRQVGFHAGHPFFVMDYAERGSLKQAISQGLPTPRWAAELIRTLALAMQHAHERRMLHRDLKPANVLLREDGAPVITDFGLVKFTSPLRLVADMHATMSTKDLDSELDRLARELEAQYSSFDDASAVGGEEIARTTWEQCASRTGILSEDRLPAMREFLTEAHQQHWETPPVFEGVALDDLTDTGAVMGSPSYMAPEQASGDHARIGPRTDVYALGGILYELLTGRPPFRAESYRTLLFSVWKIPPTPPRQFVSDMSRDIEAVCLKCLEKSPDCRYENAMALADDLSRFLDGYSPRAVVTEFSSTQSPSSAAIEEVLPTLSLDRSPPADRPAMTRSWRSWWPFGKSRSKSPEGSSDADTPADRPHD